MTQVKTLHGIAPMDYIDLTGEYNNRLDGNPNSAETACKKANAENTGGYNDWRIPTKGDMLAFFAAAKHVPDNGLFWSSSECPCRPGWAYIVEFGYGFRMVLRDSNSAVRLVRYIW